MPGLILNLKPWETFLVGNVVLQNGGRRTQLRVSDDKAGVLRLSDALHPDQVTTPLTRAYHMAQLLLLGQVCDGVSAESLRELLMEAQAALGDTKVIAEALAYAEQARYFKVLRTLKPHLPSEAMLLNGGFVSPAQRLHSANDR